MLNTNPVSLKSCRCDLSVALSLRNESLDEPIQALFAIGDERHTIQQISLEAKYQMSVLQKL